MGRVLAAVRLVVPGLPGGMLGRWAFQLAAHNVFGLFADASIGIA